MPSRHSRVSPARAPDERRTDFTARIKTFPAKFISACSTIAASGGVNERRSGMFRINRSLAIAVVALSLAVSASAFAAKKYQVTGVVTKLTDKIITVEKGSGNDKENWEIDR